MMIRLTPAAVLLSAAVCLSLGLAGCQRQAPQQGNGPGTPETPQQGTASVTLAVTGMS